VLVLQIAVPRRYWPIWGMHILGLMVWANLRKLVGRGLRLRPRPRPRGNAAGTGPGNVAALGAVARSGDERPYRRRTVIWARRMDAPFWQETPTHALHGQAGDYLCRDEHGHQWVEQATAFLQKYEPVE
jgi:hypothetical protein